MAETSMEHENMNMPFDLPVSWRKYSQVGDVLTNLYKSIMVKGVDYDTLPGSNKPSCLKPGAELLSKVFNIRDEITGTECVEHMEGEHPYVQYRVKVTGYNGRGERISDGTGSASSLEPKYAKTMDTLLHKLQRKGENVSEINVLAGVQNTILKMAAKRAYIDMVLRAPVEAAVRNIAFSRWAYSLLGTEDMYLNMFSRSSFVATYCCSVSSFLSFGVQISTPIIWL